MNYNFKRTLEIETFLDGSEAIMFNKGGKHKIELNLRNMIDDDEDNDPINLLNYDKLIFSVQMSDAGKTHFNFITSEANSHREFYDSESKGSPEEYEAAKERMKNYEKDHYEKRTPFTPAT